MSDEIEGRVVPRDHAGGEHYGETLLYDFAKALTSLAVLVLGGMLTLGGTAEADDIPLHNLALASGAVAFAGVTAFSTAHAIADARARGRQPRADLARWMKIGAGAFGLGVGAFMAMWLDSLR